MAGPCTMRCVLGHAASVVCCLAVSRGFPGIYSSANRVNSNGNMLAVVPFRFHLLTAVVPSVFLSLMSPIRFSD